MKWKCASLNTSLLIYTHEIQESFIFFELGKRKKK